MDAFLANRDVLNPGNMLQTEDKSYYRIDFGGSLHFRGREKMLKEFPSDEVVEIESMRDRTYLSALYYFNHITPEMIQTQIESVSKLFDEKAIDTIIKRAGLEGEFGIKMREALIGRINFLKLSVQNPN
jgi:hypothetical protein